MSKLILFSSPTEQAMQEVRKHIFNPELEDKRLAFVPSEGMSNYNEKYRVVWEKDAKNHGFELVYIDLGAENFDIERAKFTGIKNLFVTGGNTFTLLNLLRKTGFDKDIIEFSKTKEAILTGFSAGAMIMTPTIAVAGYNWNIGHDDNYVNLKDLTGLNLVDFEVVPHYDESIDLENLENYKKSSEFDVRSFTDEQVLIINL